jgi:hypothetical protein
VESADFSAQEWAWGLKSVQVSRSRCRLHLKRADVDSPVYYTIKSRTTPIVSWWRSEFRVTCIKVSPIATTPRTNHHDGGDNTRFEFCHLHVN